MAFSKTLIDSINNAGAEVYSNGVFKTDSFNPNWGGVIEIRPKSGRVLDYNYNHSFATFKIGPVVYNNDRGDEKGVFFDIDWQDKYTGTWAWITQGSIVTKEAPKPVEPSWKITKNNLNSFSDGKSTLKINGVVATLNSPIISGDAILAVPNSGYKLQDVSANGIASDGRNVSITFTDKGNGSWEGIFPDEKSLLALNFNLHSEELPVVVYTLLRDDFRSWYKLTVNGTEKVMGDDVSSGDIIKLVITDPKRLFNRVYMSGGDSTGEFTISEDGLTASWTARKASNNVSWSYISASSKEAPQIYTIKQKDIDVLSAKHVTMTINGKTAVVGSVMKAGDNLVMLPDSGWGIVSARIVDGLGSGVIIFNVQDGGSKATATVNDLMQFNYGATFDVTSEQKTPEVRSSFNNIYLVTPETMAEINKKRFILEASGGENQTIEIKDYGQYILGLIDLPFAIDPSYILESENVILGNKQISVQTPKINSDIIRVDLGKIVVDGEFNNSLDYVGVTALLHLPRLSPINIGLEYVIGCEIGITYYIDVYDGTATINISSSKVGDVIITQKVNMGFNVPYINEVSSGVENSSISVGGDNGVTRPFIELVKTELILPTGFYTIPVIDEGNLTGKTGYIEVDNINLNTTATAIERELIINTLKSGVIIND